LTDEWKEIDMNKSLTRIIGLLWALGLSACETGMENVGTLDALEQDAGKVTQGLTLGSWTVWSTWRNRDNPGGTGDYETLASFADICHRPVAIECQTLAGEDHSTTGQNVVCSPSVGFFCRNEDQSNGLCLDYKVRFRCPIDISNPRNPIDMLGQLHNQGLDELMRNKRQLSSGLYNWPVAMKKISTNYLHKSVAAIDAEITAALSTLSGPDVSSEVISDTGYALLDELFDLTWAFLANEEVLSFFEDTQDLENRIARHAGLTKQEKMQLLYVTAVTRHSIMYWLVEFERGVHSEWANPLGGKPVSLKGTEKSKWVRKLLNVAFWDCAGAVVGGAAVGLATAGAGAVAGAVGGAVVASGAAAIEGGNTGPF
jgi:hypothetical protein